MRSAISSPMRARDALYLRGLEERNHHSVVLRKSPDPHVKTLGFKLASEEELDKAARFFGERQLPHRFVEKPFQGRTLSATDPLGMPLEFYFAMDQLPVDAAEIRRLSRRQDPAHRPHQLLHARRAGEP